MATKIAVQAAPFIGDNHQSEKELKLKLDKGYLSFVVTAVFLTLSIAFFICVKILKPIAESEKISPRIILAGNVSSVEYHDSLLSGNSTIRTTVGIYQVRGAVSAKIGDAVYLEIWMRYDKKENTLVCIKSEPNKVCYRQI